MLTEERVKEALGDVLVPGVVRSLEKMNLVQQVIIEDSKVEVKLASAALDQGAQNFLQVKVREAVKELPETKEVEVVFSPAQPKEVNKIGKVVAVMSGKGGVGKSLVTSLVAVSLARHGCDVGILDADITGPSIPRMFGVSGMPEGSDTGLRPLLSRAGISMMSINLLLPDEDQPVIWRGPLIGGAIKQFWEDVLWGKLDYLMVDLPPGTADAPLTVMQTLSVSGVIIVFSPQELAAMVVRKAVNMARQMNIPILGVVENMSYLLLPETGKRMEIFGKSRANEMVQAAGAPLLGRIPIDPDLSRLSDDGEIEKYQSDPLSDFSRNLLQRLNNVKE